MQSSGKREVTGANVLVAIFSEQESQAVYFLKKQSVARIDVVNYIAHGISNGLLERAADVCLKERRKLILVTRETPLSLIHLRNMTAVTEAGAIVLPGSPGFYYHPDSVQDLVDMVAGRILAHLGVDSSLLKEWTGPEPARYSE